MINETSDAQTEHFRGEAGTMIPYHLVTEQIGHLAQSVVECYEEIDAVSKGIAIYNSSFVEPVKVLWHEKQ